MSRLAALAIVSIAAGSAAAHHSQVGLFHSDQTVEITGVVTHVSWRNPHGQILLEVTDENGEVTEWDAETASISVMRNRGLDGTNAVAVGDRVTIAGAPSARNRPEMLARAMLLPSGFEFTFGSREPHFPEGQAGRIYGAPVVLENVEESIASADGIFRVWSTDMLDPEQFPMFRGGYPLTAAGQAGWDAFDPRDNSLLKCGTKGQPLIMITPLPVEFVDQGDTILMRIEEYDSRRVIHMSPDAQPPEEHTLMGFSKGHFEGRDLVVETTHIAAGYFDHNGVPMSEQIKTVERFMPTEDYSRLDYSLTTTDPVNFTEAFTLTRHFEWNPGDFVHPYECLDRF
ncbi:MAG TPA: DUF6152 family protein [Gammaproteobacteria bacterium]|nr:DUF6152 family protein [Gammaproteobacteria bacterium]